MEELKILVGLIADLPQTAIWVLIGFFCWKIFYVGGIMLTVKIILIALIKAIHDWLQKEAPPKVIEVDGFHDSNFISSHTPDLITFVEQELNTLRINMNEQKEKRGSITTPYVHDFHINEFKRIYRLGKKTDRVAKEGENES